MSKEKVEVSGKSLLMESPVKVWCERLIDRVRKWVENDPLEVKASAEKYIDTLVKLNNTVAELQYEILMLNKMIK